MPTAGDQRLTAGGYPPHNGPIPLSTRAQGVFRIIKNQRGGGSPKTPSPPTKLTIVGKREICNRGNLVGPFLVHKLLGPKPGPPLPPPTQKTPCPSPEPLAPSCREVGHMIAGTMNDADEANIITL